MINTMIATLSDQVLSKFWDLVNSKIRNWRNWNSDYLNSEHNSEHNSERTNDDAIDIYSSKINSKQIN